MSSVYSTYPSIFLSANATVNFKNLTVPQASIESLTQMHQVAQRWANQLKQDYNANQTKRQQIIEFCTLLNQNRLLLAPRVKQHSTNRQHSNQNTLAFLNQAAMPQKSHQSREFLVHDSFFGIYRVRDQTWIDFLDQFFKLYELTLLDIQFSEIPSNELACLVQILDPILSICLKKVKPQNEIIAKSHVLDDTSSWAFSTYWESRPMIQDESEKQDLALFRWLCGHQLWSCILNFLCAHLEHSLSLLQQGQHLDQLDQLQKSIGQSSDLIRGFTSLLWYILDFPPYLYQKYISPAMEAHSRQYGSLGLSGTQGQDFRQYKASVNALSLELLAKFGKQHKDWPSGIYLAFEQIQENELLFHEHHILLSQQKIQLNYESVLQRVSSDNQNSGLRISAMDAMRNIRDAKRKRIKSFLD